MNGLGRNDRIVEVWMKVIDHKRLAKLMAIQEVSHRDLARVIGWRSHSYVGRIVRGEIKSIEPDAAAKIAVTLGVGMDDLFVPRVSAVSTQNEDRGAA